jgi:hypothetical protein
MARNHGWTVVMALLVGVLGASIFWLYGPYLKRQVAGQVAEAMKGQPLNVEMSKGAPADLKGVPSQAWGSRYQMVADGEQVFLADLKEGRVWRYFHQTREGGSAREDEGFLPIALYYGGKKYYSASEVEPILGKPAEATPPKAGEAKR